MATLRDIYRFGSGPQVEATGYSNLDSGQYQQVIQNAGQEGGNITHQWTGANPFLDSLEQQYGPGTVNRDYRAAESGNEAGSTGGSGPVIDMSRLPDTKFGPVSRTAPVITGHVPRAELDPSGAWFTSSQGSGTGLRNPGMVYNDPNYGNITHRANVTGGNDWLGPVLMAIVSMGMGGLMAPAAGAAAASAGHGLGALNMGRLGLAGVNAARTLGSGGSPLSAISSLATPFAPVLGISPDILSGARTAWSLGQAARARRGGG